LSGWTAIVPLKTAGQRKTRLAGALSPRERDRLTQALFDHVIGVLDACPAIGRIGILSETGPTREGLDWLPDRGRGLNPELQALDIAGPRLVIHADLPLVDREDIEALLAAGRGGGAIAPDRHATGVNALALDTGISIEFRFGPGSLARHLEQLPARLAVVARQGLGHDIDTPDDLAHAIRLGFGLDEAAEPLAATPPKG
jgi:2-phospho-L-lactate guanylyltransferase